MVNINKLKQYHIIYKTTDTRNGNYYLGMHSTNNLNDSYIGSGKRLWYTINKYGKEIFKYEILEFLPDRESLKKREKEIINEETLRDSKCINLKPGGYGGYSHEHQIINGQKGIKVFLEMMKDPEFSKLQSEKISIGVRKALKHQNKNGFWDGKHHTEETKKLIGSINSKHQIGEGNSQYGTCWITNGKENKKTKKDTSIPEGWILGRTL